MKQLFTILTFAIFYSNLAYSQVTTQNISSFPITPNGLVDTISGTGVQITNVSYVGDVNSIGYFQSGNNTVGIQSGIVMSTGHIGSIPSYTVNSEVGTSGSMNTNGEVDLSIIANAQTFDASVLEMDFVSSGDSVEIEMVFASEEYPEYVCSFNDVFAFFVSGDGFNGNYTNNAENIALIPNTNDVISIGTVNGGIATGTATPCVLTNTNYYISNPVVLTGNSNLPIYFDGLTTVIKVKFGVTPDSTYHFKIAIADALDQVFDSAIFLKAKSFSSNGLPFTIPELAITTSLGGGWVNEQCGSIELGVNLGNPLTQTDTFEIVTAGTATANVDYLNMPNYLIGNIGDTVISPVTIDIVSDNMIESVENIKIYLKQQGVIIDSAFISISDSSMLYTNLQNTSICAGDTISLDGTIVNASASNSQSFNNITPMPIIDDFLIPNISIINVSGVPTGASVESVCIDINHIWSSDLDIYLVSPTQQVIELSTDNSSGLSTLYINTCFSQSATSSIKNAVAPATGSYLPEQNLNALTNSAMNGDWSLVIVDDGFGFAGTLNNWSLTFSDYVELDYTWSPAGLVDCDTCAFVSTAPTVSTDYVVMITDLLGCSITDSVFVDVLARTQFNMLPCSNITDSTLTFNWQTDGTETESEISFDNGLTWTTISAGVYSYPMTNLQAGTDYGIMLRANNQTCDGIAINDTCSTTGCVSVDFTITVVDATDTTGGSINLNINNSTGVVHFLWNTGDTTASLTNLQAGIYNVTVTDSNNCPVLAEVIICGAISPTITTVADSGFVNLGAINVSIQGGFPPYVYQWNNGSTGNALSGLLSGTYNAIVIDSIGCTHLISATVSDLVGNYMITELENLTISPNPTADLVNVQMRLSEYLPVNIYVRDMTGKLLMNKSLESNMEHQTTFDLSDFANGTYILQFELNEKTFSKQVILQR